MNRLLLPLLCGLAASAAAQTVEVTLHTQAPGRAISALIYGSNHDVEGHVFRAARRLGGNRLSAYNWAIDASNAGKDFRHNSDRWLTKQDWWQDTAATAARAPALPRGDQAQTIHRFHRESLVRGSMSLITVPLAGYVVADADGPVTQAQTAPSPRWVEAGDGQALTQHLVDTYGGAAHARGIGAYSLGNEPALWHSTHPRLRPKPVACADLLERSVRSARAIKRADADAQVFGPALWGITAYASLSKADDWPEVKQRDGYGWFIDAYLDTMRQAAPPAGPPLLDALDVHWYTQAPTDRDWTGAQAARAAKALHDPKHHEDNWVGKHFARFLPLIPRLQKSIDQYHPGAKIAITEYDWPMTGTVYGGLAQADALGAFGRLGVYFASYHHYTHQKPDRYVGSAFQLFRNYDQQGAAFGDVTLPATFTDHPDLDVYASINRDTHTVHAVILCRRETQPAEVVLRLDAGAEATHPTSWFFDAQSPEVRRGAAPHIHDDGRITLTVAPLSACHVVLPLARP